MMVVSVSFVLVMILKCCHSLSVCYWGWVDAAGLDCAYFCSAFRCFGCWRLLVQFTFSL